MGRALSLLWSPTLLASTAVFVCHWEGGEGLMTALLVGKSFNVLSDFSLLSGYWKAKFDFVLCLVSQLYVGTCKDM